MSNKPTTTPSPAPQPAHAGAAHTPAPWRLKDGEIYGRHKGRPSGCIAKVWDSGNIPESAQEANGKLLAAAPALLAALERLLIYANGFTQYDISKGCPKREAEAALALARQ